MRQAYKTLPVITSLILAFGVGVGGCSKSKQPEQAPAEGAAAAPQAQAPPPAAGAQAPDATPVQLPDVNLSAAGLDELLAPIALYPDPVLAVMLETSKNPQEVMDAGNFLALPENANLKDAALDQASKAAGFTPVAQALLHFGPVVDLMCTQFDWTKQLGAAYTADPKAVLASVQRLRAQAVDNGMLRSSPKMKVALKNDQGAQIVEITNPDPTMVNIPQYDPALAYAPPAADVPPPVAAPPAAGQTVIVNNYPPQTTTVVQQPSSGVSTGTATMIGLLSFGAGLAVGSAINHNNYYYPSWGYGGCYYGGRPYYPPPYRPVYGGYPGGYHGGGYYNRPVHYGNTNININNSNNYYNRFNGNSNTKPGYNAKPVQYNNRPGSVSSGSFGNKAGANHGVTANNRAVNTNNSNFKGQTTYQGGANRPGNAANAGAGQVNRPAAGGTGAANNMQRPAGANTSDFKGKSTYQGGANRPGNAATGGAGQPNRPAAGGAGGAGNTQRPAGGAQAGNNMQRPNPGAGAPNNMQRPAAGNASPSTRPASTGGDRGFAQGGGARPATANPGAANRQQPAARPQQPAARPQQQPSRPPSQPGGAFGGSSSAKSDKQASSRGHQSMGAPSGGQNRAAQGGRKK